MGENEIIQNVQVNYKGWKAVEDKIVSSTVGRATNSNKYVRY